jgi:beta-glucosidase
MNAPMKKNYLPVSLLYVLPVIMLMTCMPGERSASVLPVYLDTTCSFEERASDLVSRLTIEEKQSLLGNTMASVPRLGINAYNVWGEALHGVVGMFNPNYESATSFPNSVALGACWDPALMEREATAISDEARGVNHTVINGLTYWSPVVEPSRDPRWGRTGESYGEDPFLVSEIAGGFIRGLMGNESEYLKAVPTGKHFFANNSEFNRHTGTSNMDDRDAREFYLFPYKKLIEEDNLPGIMTCYNRVNYVPVTASRFFVDSVARRTFGLNGYVTGDCGAVSDIYTGHKYAGSNAEAAAMALKAGVDTDCGNVFQSSAIDALKEGLIEESDIDRALAHMFTIRMRIGEFDSVDIVPYAGIPPEVVNSPEHTALALEVATKTPVLLKNTTILGTDTKALPLKAGEMKKIAVIGPMAERVVLGPYSGTPLESDMITPLDGIKDYLSQIGSDAEVVYSPGANTRSRSNLFHVRSFGIVKANGDVTEIDATKYDASSGGFAVDSRNEVPSLRRITDGSWTAYFRIELSDIDSFSVDLSVLDAGGSIEARVGSVTGNLLAGFKVPAPPETGGGFMFRRPRTITTKVNQPGLSGRRDLYLVYHAPAVLPIDKETLSMASSADVAVVFVGTDDRTASEESDRITLLLPGNQYELIKAVAGANPHTVVVMQTLGMVETDQFKDMDNVPGILWTGYNGQAQGAAMARILFGEVNPGGKLNATWHRSVNDLPDIADYELRGGDHKNGRTYWYFDRDVSYEFGYGLSYTTFEYSNFRISSPAVTPNDKITISVDVTNTGDVDGDEVVQVYVRTPDSPAALQRPIKRLKGFQRVPIPAGQTRTVAIEIDCAGLWFWDAGQERIIFDQGRYLFEIGASSRDIRGTVEAVLTGTYNAVLETVVAECGRVVLNLDEVVRTDVSATMSDDGFYDVTKARVVYSSSNPDVLRVDRKGQVTAAGPGTASVTAHVTVDGISVSDSYALTVLPDLTLSSILVDGKELAAFDAGAGSYGILLGPEAQPVPQVGAKASRSDVTIEIDQAERIPGTAIITATDRATGKEKTYMLNFGLSSAGDEFGESRPGSQWSWIRENDEHWSLTDFPGYLTIAPGDGDIQGNANNAENILVQSANTDWVIESGLEFTRRPQRSGEQGGIVACQDEDNYVKLIYTCARGRMFGDSESYIELAVEREGSQYTSARIPASGSIEEEDIISVRLKLEKKGSSYTAYYSTDGESFMLLGSTEAVLSDIRAGLIACNGAAPSGRRSPSFRMQQQRDIEPLKVRFDYFRIENTGSQ